MKNNFKYFCNTKCEFFPCHKDVKDFNCKFCYCPLYDDLNCGGNFNILENNVKDCSNCTIIHEGEAGFEFVYNHSVVLDDFYIISHTPMVGISVNAPFANVFAHVHDDPAYKDYSCRSFCVSAERINYTPVEFKVVKEKMKAVEELQWHE
jgi:Zn-finger protein